MNRYIQMLNSKDEKVQKFLEDLMIFDNEKLNIIDELRKIVFANIKDASERIMYGGIMFSCKKDWGGVFASKNHVSFEFGEGFQLNDPYNLLEGTGKKRRHLKIKTLADIKDKKVEFYVKQVLKLSC